MQARPSCGLFAGMRRVPGESHQPMPLAAILAPLAIAILVQALPTFGNLAMTTLGPDVTRAIGLPAGAIGAYVAVVYGAATLGSFGAAGAVLRFGPIRASQGALALYVVGGIMVFMVPGIMSIAFAAILFGIAYTVPIPAGAQILIRHTPPHLQNTLFSIRQCGVPIGGMMAGLLFPTIAAAFGWETALLAVAGACGIALILIQGGRGRYDAERQPALPLLKAGAHSPLATIRRGTELRRLCIAGIIFAGFEVTFVANITAHLFRDGGWTLIEAGRGLGALQFGGLLGRLLWGRIADGLANRSVMLGLIGLGMAGSGVIMGMMGLASPALAYTTAFAIGLTGGGWTGVGVAEAARLAGSTGAVAGTAALTMAMFFGIVALPLLVSAALIAGITYSTVFIALGMAAGCGGLLMLMAPPVRPEAV